ncbi:hypothetical protein PTSG_06294 [Salpingoeca rosetta]|uniref:Uncharacterized protein n=1 Tax=Salpingoeca rosetta (strain ATCC 50818 / BSB-021) TaxID=946362 RepID=F2UCH8_SALR5|nr:uncharacterized protein PTSG_06294 [Salpingoeca rosetta]EGD74285.1 hypothetical protein PTSG_06294 [Salpingoeca rosetta]|eukprot:XP_004993185.1 hypothetical protein PTSG_06294 [Salpingoeca rosetta]
MDAPKTTTRKLKREPRDAKRVGDQLADDKTKLLAAMTHDSGVDVITPTVIKTKLPADIVGATSSLDTAPATRDVGVGTTSDFFDCYYSPLLTATLDDDDEEAQMKRKNKEDPEPEWYMLRATQHLTRGPWAPVPPPPLVQLKPPTSAFSFKKVSRSRPDRVCHTCLFSKPCTRHPEKLFDMTSSSTK